MKNKIISNDIPKEINTPFLYRITKTVILSLVIFCLFLIILYVIGNFQKFQDLSQQTILNVLFYSSVLTMFLTFPVMIEDIIMLFIIKRKLGRIISLILTVLGNIFLVFCIILSGAVEILSSGF